MFRSKQQLGCAIPNRDHHFVSSKEGLERFIGKTSETEVTDFDDALVGDEDVGGFEITMDDVGLMEVE